MTEIELDEAAREGVKQRIYESLLFKSPSPAAAALHSLNPRDAPSPPGCPSDDGFDPTFGFGLPDAFGKVFHPNEKGHITIASYAVEKMMQLRARRLGKDASCSIIQDEFRCHSTDDKSRGYASGEHMNENYRDFCNTLSPPKNTLGVSLGPIHITLRGLVGLLISAMQWTVSKTYHEGTPDEHTIKLELSDKIADWAKDECLDAFGRITNGCDTNGDTNPMMWKGGGMWRKGERTYSIDIKRSNRPWPPPKKPYGDCDSQYKAVLSSFFLHGGGWVSHDKGEALKKAAGACTGSEPSSWKFWYYDEPDENGMEWSASFNTPIWVKARCFQNDKVQKGAGGLSSGCKGSG